jgi:ubiquinone/menaquinone biosynthesis C-methylase UbiE
MAANYNNSAWFYDRLSALVYGKALIKAQVYLLKFIEPDSKVLLVGGGTGRILEEIAKTHPSGLKITYVEIAPKMVELSKKRDSGSNEVIFITDAIENVKLADDFDIVFTPFLFDNFTEENFQRLFAHIHQSLKSGGLWLNTDFQLTGRWWQHILLRSMFVFFRLICRIEGNKLPDITKCFADHGYESVDQQTFYGKFILSSVYRRVSS